MTRAARVKPAVPVADLLVLRVAEAAALVGMDPDTFRRVALHSGQITTWKLHPRGDDRILRSELDRWIGDIQQRREQARSVAELAGLGERATG